MLIVNIIYIIFTLTVGFELSLLIYDVPEDIFNTFLLYNNTLVFYFPFLCYILTLGYFVRSDGYPNLPFFSLLIANVSNIVISFIMMGVFNFGVEGSALGTVIGYAIGSVYISTYFLKENREYHLTFDINFGQSFRTFFEFLRNTPEIISRLFLSIKILFYNILCTHYLGIVGLMAFLVYDNSETLVYMFLSAIGKVMSPIVAVFYKEKDYESVEFIVRKWYALVLADIVPLIIYIISIAIFANKNSLKIRAMFLLQETNTVTWTYERGIDDVDYYLQDEKKTFALKLENMLIEKSPVAIQCIDDVFENIMKDESIEKIDVIVRYLDNTVTITLTYGGKLINPITEKDIGLIGEIDGDLEYSPILGYNRAYINVKV